MFNVFVTNLERDLQPQEPQKTDLQVSISHETNLLFQSVLKQFLTFGSKEISYLPFTGYLNTSTYRAEGLRYFNLI